MCRILQSVYDATIVGEYDETAASRSRLPREDAFQWQCSRESLLAFPCIEQGDARGFVTCIVDVFLGFLALAHFDDVRFIDFVAKHGWTAIDGHRLSGDELVSPATRGIAFHGQVFVDAHGNAASPPASGLREMGRGLWRGLYLVGEV